MIRPVGSAVPTPVCKLSYGSENTACHKLWLWHPASHLSALQVSASRTDLPSGPPMPAVEGSSLKVPTDPGGAAHRICNRGQALRAAHLPYVLFMTSRDVFADANTSGLKGPGLAFELP